MQEDPHSSFSKSATSKTLRVVTVVLVMAFLTVSPFFTFRLFHPDGAAIRWPMKNEYLLDLQISQLEPLLFSLAALWYFLVYRKVSSQLLCIVPVVALHMFVAFWLIAIRGQGGLRWLN